jgi:hypothetical protein
MTIDGEKYQPNCMLAHDLVNRFAVIVGYCDLLLEEVSEDPKRSRRLLVMRDVARSAAEKLVDDGCRLMGSAQPPLARSTSLGEREGI